MNNLKSALKATPLFGSLNVSRLASRKWLAAQKHGNELTLWRKQLARQGTLIALPLTFTGRDDPQHFLSVGAECQLEQDVQVWISPRSNADPLLCLQDRVFIGRSTYLGVHQPILIGSDTIVGAFCYLISANHNYESREVPIREQGFTGAPIIIENDVWIGTHAVVLPGVKIGRGAIVAAGAVVNRSIPAYEVWGGVPARFIKCRP